jgi:GT2 family glycosyltransferase
MSSVVASLIVLNWNGRALLERCLPSICAQIHPAFEVIVVDNASTDDSVAFLRTRHPNVQLIRSDQNRRYAGGMNLGLRQARGELLALLNNDVLLRPDWLTQMEAVFAADARIGLAGGKLHYPDELTLQHAGGIMSFPLALPKHWGYGETDRGQWDRLNDVDFVTGAALVLRRAAFTQIGALDEAFTFYFEDVDLAFRARQLGWRVVYAPAAVGVHLESASSTRDDLTYFTHFHQSRLRFQLKHYGCAAYLDHAYPAEKHRLPQTRLFTERRALNQVYLRGLLEIPRAAWPCDPTPALAGAFNDLRAALRALPPNN